MKFNLLTEKYKSYNNNRNNKNIVFFLREFCIDKKSSSFSIFAINATTTKTCRNFCGMIRVFKYFDICEPR